MSNKEPGMFYNTNKLNKIFAVISVIFLISVLWLFLDDYIRPWKAFQLKGMDIEKEVTQKKIQEIDSTIDKKEVTQVETEIKAETSEMEKHQKAIDKINDKLEEVNKLIYIQNMQNGSNGANAGAYQFKYEHYFSHGEFEEAKEYKELLDKYKALEISGKDKLKSLELQKLEVVAELGKFTSKKEESEKRLSDLTGARDRLLLVKEKTEKSPLFLLRNLPFIDFMDPTLKVRQVVISNVSDDRYFQQTPKVDRCMTCHVFIDKPGFEDKEQPYRTHPKLDELAVGINSKHPMKDFGCTSCHQGEGHRVFDFNSPAHTPRNEEQAKVWEKKYGWHEAHHIPQAMYPLQNTEASCVKCHKSSETIAMADKLDAGRELIRTNGCYGCHKIEGWEHLRKPGPELTKIQSKLSKEFIKNWIWSPFTFNAHSRMPAFFNQANNSKPEFMIKNMAEVNAMADYIWNHSTKQEAFAKYTVGNAEKGKALIQTVGCIACHQVEGLDEPYSNVKSKRAPYLTGIGSKVDPDWLVSWLIKPSHHQEDTIMPSFRLSKTEADDIATYLLSLKNPTFEKLQFAPLDKVARDEILISYFAQFEPVSMAKQKLAKLTDAQRTEELGKRSIGKYGCYSCHNIEGFEPDRAPIGPELTNEGSKPITQFGYGQQHDVGHSREAWLFAHLKQPSRWDIGVPKKFEDLNRMPNFYMSDSEASSIVTAILGQVSDKVPLAGQHILKGEDAVAEQGKRVLNKYNCFGCHKIDGQGGVIGAAYADDLAQGPPWLVQNGHRTQADWLYNFLGNVQVIRPWLTVRMPSFHFVGDDQSKIQQYFQSASKQFAFTKKEEIVWETGEREAAQKMWNELACVSCHTQGFNNEPAQGADLRLAHKRLRPSWIKKWLSDPPAVLPYTAMPSFWNGGKDSAVEGVLGNDPDKQMNAMVKYILELENRK